ncbi:hypothetical protein JB92DRAFT_1743630 [Gautieria morchelliformis]|nr:hypothetical protein JB92DRAFT_1743630 [Gautieria morchelliformis]
MKLLCFIRSHSPSQRTPRSYMPLQRGTACFPCRYRKLKCGGEKPTCSQCISHDDRGCAYEDTRTWGKNRRLQLQITDLKPRRPDTPTPPIESKPVVAAFKPNNSPCLVHAPEIVTGFSLPQLASSLLLQANAQGGSLNGFDPTYTPSGLHGCPTVFTTDMAIVTPSPSFFQLRMTSESQNVLLTAFFPHSDQFYLDLNAVQIQSRVAGAPHNPIHDSFLHAMFLIGCRFDGRSLIRRHELRFRQRAQSSLRLPICHADLGDCIRAACLLACYAYINDSLSEAQGHVRLAKNLIYRLISQDALVTSGTPLDEAPLDRVLLLQQVSTTSRIIAAYLGEDVSAEQPQVPESFLVPPFWSRTCFLRSWVSTVVACLGNRSTSAMLSSSDRGPLDRKVVSTIHAHAADLLWVASQSLKSSSQSIFFQPSLQDMESSTKEVHADMSCLVGTLKEYLPSSHPRGLVDCSTICFHTQIYASLLVIMGGEQSPPEDLCEDLVGELIALLKELWDQDYKYLEPILGLCWQWLAEHLLDEIWKFDVEHARKLGESIKLVLTAMHKLSWEFPVAAVNLANITSRCSQWGLFPI